MYWTTVSLIIIYIYIYIYIYIIDNGCIDGWSQIKVHNDERTQVHTVFSDAQFHGCMYGWMDIDWQDSLTESLTTVHRYRYFGLTKPAGESFISAAAAVWIVMAMWTLIVAANLPLLLWSGLSYDVNTTVVSCTLLVANGNAYDTKQVVFISCSRVFDYFIPLFINWFCYVSIIHKFRSSLARVRCLVSLIIIIDNNLK